MTLTPVRLFIVFNWKKQTQNASLSISAAQRFVLENGLRVDSQFAPLTLD
jgi:hypothetical protein